MERREFIKQSIATGLTVAGTSSAILGANDRIRMGVIGLGRQGRGVMKGFLKNSNVEVVALCDVYAPHLATAIKDSKLDAVEAYKDFRKLLDRKDIDAVIVASPDHWHALHSVMACQAGKGCLCRKADIGHGH
ncbi:MAG: Gfo/Idh/MocA family oxidoreductase [Acidobacteria bacterium]|nr:Gfo/Idh/MocA family oxidoreductase [Acidobacteriota bacterium]